MKATAVVNNLDTVWSSLSSADRFALLGHDRDELDANDRARLATMIAKARKG